MAAVKIVVAAIAACSTLAATSDINSKTTSVDSASGSPVITYDSLGGAPYQVTYDNRSLFINGSRTLFFSFGMHYPRTTAAMWYDLLAKAKADGYNMVQTYVFWNAHQHKPDDWDFDGGFGNWYNLTRFVQTAQDVGLFVNLRIGPYVCAEWNMGGYPLWIKDVAGLVDRSSSAAWEAAMSAFFAKVITSLRGYFADRGGPIALAQVENELHTGDTAYVAYCGQLAAQYPLGNQWEMCNGNSASNTINSCNGGSCTGFIESYGQNGQVLKTQPALWTEDWIGWYQQWTDGGSADINGGDYGMATGKSYGYLQWIARGGSHHNFYMAFGGNNMRRMQGAATMPWYYVDAVLNSDGLSNEPVRSHMRNLQTAVASIGSALLNNPAQVHQQVNLSWVSGPKQPAWSITGKQYAFIYGSGITSAAFLENSGSGGIVQFNGRNYSSNGGSILVLNGTGDVIFDTSKPAPYVTSRSWTPLSNVSMSWSSWSEAPTVTSAAHSKAGAPLSMALTRPKWQSGTTNIGAVINNAVPLEQLDLTEDDTEHMYYSASIGSSVLRAALVVASASPAGQTTLVITSAKSMAIAVYLAGSLVGIGYELSEDAGKHQFNVSLSSSVLRAALHHPHTVATGATTLVLHSESMGIHKFSSVNNGPTPAQFHTTAIKGITSNSSGSVVLGGVDITAPQRGWTMTVGLVGEAKQVWTAAGSNSVQWTSPPVLGPASWYRTAFTAPNLTDFMRAGPSDAEVSVALHLDSTGLGRAHFYINNYEVSRAWTRTCGSDPCQRYYYIPPDILLPGANANTLTVFDAEGPVNLSSVQLVVARVSPPPPCTSTPLAGQNLTLAPCQSTTGMVWTFQSCTSSPSVTGQFVLTKTAGSPTGPLCMAVFGTNPLTGSQNVGLQPCIAQAQCASATSQLFVPGPVTAPNSIQHAATGNCLDLPNQDTSVGTRVELWSCNGGSNQMFSYDAGTGAINSAIGGVCAGVCFTTSEPKPQPAPVIRMDTRTGDDKFPPSLLDEQASETNIAAQYVASALQDSIALTVDIDDPLGSMPSNLAGFGWEMWGFLGTYQTQLADPIYRTIARGIGGATVRLGGITADWTTYEIASSDSGVDMAGAAQIAAEMEQMDFFSKRSAKKAHQLQGFWPNNTQPLTTTTFLNLLDFLGQADMHLLLDLNELIGRNCQTTNPACSNPADCPDWCVGQWNTSNLQAFLQWIHDQKLYSPPSSDGTGGSTLIGFELGNELVSHLDPVDNVKDIVTLVGLVQSVWSDVPATARPPVFAPSTDNCYTNDTRAIMQNITGVANVFTFHAYPGQSGEGNMALASILLNSTWLRTGILTGSSAIQCLDWWNSGPRKGGLGLWITEASSSWTWQLPPPAQNSFIHGFFTIPELGQYAASGVGMIGRWSFGENSPFGLVVNNNTRGQGMWDVSADYFVLHLFNQTRSVGAGSAVLAVTGDAASSALLYAHCASGSAVGAGPGSITLMAVNPSDTSVYISTVSSAKGLAIPTVPRQEYVLTAPGGNLSSLTPLLNGQTVLRINEDGSLPSMPPSYITGTATIELPPQSQGYYVLLNAGAGVCQ